MNKSYQYDLWSAYSAKGSAQMKYLEDRHKDKGAKDAPTPELKQIMKHLDPKDKERIPNPVPSKLNEQFCSLCRRLLEGRNQAAGDYPESDLIGPHYVHWDLPSLGKSAISGCPLCLLAYGSIQTTKKTQSLAGSVTGTCHFAEYMSFEKDKLYAVRFYLHQTLQDGSFESSYQLPPYSTISLQRTDALRHYISSTIPTTSTSSDATLKQLELWLENCNKSHSCTTVESHIKTPFLPSRLIFVGSDTSPRLIESKEILPGSRYISLSHCWGKTQLGHTWMNLTGGNLESFKRELPSDALPPTFQDTIKVARYLGIEYVWIDSICIIQDSKEDWINEAARMWEVYAFSYLNVSATASTSANEGLFRDRPLATVLQAFVSIDSGHSHFEEGEYMLYDDQEWVRCIDNSPISSRAWVVQERFLSRRVVHFSDNQIFWECRQLRASEMLPNGLPPHYEDGVIRPFLDGQPERQDRRALLELWDHVVSRYTEASLTFSSDKLIAVSALAKQVSTAFDPMSGGYVVGLWKNHLTGQLLWSSASGSNSRCTDNRAPTWSWASIDGPIRPNFDWIDDGAHSEKFQSKPMIKILDVTVSADSFSAGLAESGVLRISGPLLKVSLIAADTKEMANDAVVNRAMARMRPAANSANSGEEHTTGQDSERQVEGKEPVSRGEGDAAAEEHKATSRQLQNGKIEEKLKRRVIQSMSSIPGYTGGGLKSFAVSEGNEPNRYRLYVDPEHGLVATNAGQIYPSYVRILLFAVRTWAFKPRYILSIPFSSDAEEPIPPPSTADLDWKISFGWHHARVRLDEKVKNTSDLNLFLVPVLCYSSINGYDRTEGTSVYSMGGLLLTPSGAGNGQFRRVGFCDFEDHTTCEFLCELGNQDEAELQFEKRSEATLRVEDVVPENWPMKTLSFTPKELRCYDISIV